jgi:hypothetical protein
MLSEPMTIALTEAIVQELPFNSDDGFRAA